MHGTAAEWKFKHQGKLTPILAWSDLFMSKLCYLLIWKFSPSKCFHLISTWYLSLCSPMMTWQVLRLDSVITERQLQQQHPQQRLQQRPCQQWQWKLRWLHQLQCLRLQQRLTTRTALKAVAIIMIATTSLTLTTATGEGSNRKRIHQGL